MTSGVSLATWHNKGMLAREMALYKKLRPRLSGVTLMTYGGREDLEIAKDYPDIRVIANRFNLPRYAYLEVAKFLMRRIAGGEKAVYKSNQMNGAAFAYEAAIRNRSSFIARCGYMLSDFKAKEQGKDSAQFAEAEAMERSLFSAAHRSIVTTEDMKRTVESYGVAPDKIDIIPNYVETDVFAPALQVEKHKKRVLFIGRISQQKNPLLLVEALAGLDVELDVVGEGDLTQQMSEAAKHHNVPIRFLGSVNNHDLPDLIRRAAVYVLPSSHEGHPKTLLEAMSCGAAVVGTDAPGIRQVIRHEETGLLAPMDTASLREAIRRLIDTPDFAERLGSAARQQILDTNSVDVIAERELAAYQRATENADMRLTA